MTYDANSIKEKELPKVGTKISAKVTKIDEGVLGDFIPKESLRKWDDADPESRCIEITAEAENGQTRRKVIQLPEDNEVHPKSNLANWKNKYGGYPTVGQEIYLLSDENGWFQFV